MSVMWGLEHGEEMSLLKGAVEPSGVGQFDLEAGKCPGGLLAVLYIMRF